MKDAIPDRLHRVGFWTVYRTRNRVEHFIAALLTVAVASVLLFIAARQAALESNEYYRLREFGVQTTGVIIKIESGGEYNYISYGFRDSQGHMVSVTEEIGRKIDGKPASSMRPEDTVSVRFLREDPSISHVVGNTDYMITCKFFAVFFGLFLCLSLIGLAHPVLKTFRIIDLYRHGQQATGTLVSKRVKSYGGELKFIFPTGMGMVMSGKEWTYNVECFKDLAEGSQLAVFFSTNRPERNAIRFA